MLTGVLTLGVIGSAGVPTFAATNADGATADGPQGLKVKLYQNPDDATKEKIQSIMDDARAKLAELGIALPTKIVKGNPFANLDDATKEKAQAIMDQVKDGTLSREDAQKQLAELGLDMPVRGNGLHLAKFQNLDDATKEKVQAIMDQVKDGSLSREDAQKQLADLGINMPVRGDGLRLAKFQNLDDATKEKVQAIMDQVKDGTLSREDAQKQLADLGLDLPAPGVGMHFAKFQNLDDTTQEKVKDIIDEVKAKIKELTENK